MAPGNSVLLENGHILLDYRILVACNESRSDFSLFKEKSMEVSSISELPLFTPRPPLKNPFSKVLLHLLLNLNLFRMGMVCEHQP